MGRHPCNEAAAFLNGLNYVAFLLNLLMNLYQRCSDLFMEEEHRCVLLNLIPNSQHTHAQPS